MYSNALTALSESDQLEDRLHAVDSLLSDVISNDIRSHKPQSQLKDKMVKDKVSLLTPSQHALQKVFVSIKKENIQRAGDQDKRKKEKRGYLERAFSLDVSFNDLSYNLAKIIEISTKIDHVRKLYKQDDGHALPGGLEFNQIRLPEGIEKDLSQVGARESMNLSGDSSGEETDPEYMDSSGVSLGEGSVDNTAYEVDSDDEFARGLNAEMKLDLKLKDMEELLKGMKGQYGGECRIALEKLSGHRCRFDSNQVADLPQLWVVVKSSVDAIVQKKLSNSVWSSSKARHTQTFTELKKLQPCDWDGLITIAKRVSKTSSRKAVLKKLSSNARKGIERSQSLGYPSSSGGRSALERSQSDPGTSSNSTGEGSSDSNGLPDAGPGR